MRQEIESNHVSDEDGNPAGGVTNGLGFSIAWQDGPLFVDGEHKSPNGAFVETVIAAVVDRIQYYQNAAGGKFACRENALTITKLEEALHWMDHRTADRTSRGVEGTHQV
ncbi:hypothetical protein LCGC14_1625970 [marine sediment metagenome]|uniref:Acb2/Tad1 hairpin domain-containing protein n=1 Tax=marine sediment metagenome TaxID=412755 RepID=A0A0F9L3S5_9ZZZZ